MQIAAMRQQIGRAELLFGRLAKIMSNLTSPVRQSRLFQERG